MAQERLRKKFDNIESLETVLNIVIKSKRPSFQDWDYSGLGIFPKFIPFPPSSCHCFTLLPYHFSWYWLFFCSIPNVTYLPQHRVLQFVIYIHRSESLYGIQGFTTGLKTPFQIISYSMHISNPTSFIQQALIAERYTQATGMQCEEYYNRGVSLGNQKIKERQVTLTRIRWSFEGRVGSTKGKRMGLFFFSYLSFYRYFFFWLWKFLSICTANGDISNILL